MSLPRAFDWNHARAFLATAEEGSLSAAARRLGLTQPTVGRQVSAFEDELGVMLFERLGRGLELTVAGRELLAQVRDMGAAADRMALTATGQAQAVEGLVRITASDVFSAHVLPPVLQRLRQVAPKFEVELVATNDIADLMRREADIAVRHVRPEQPDLIARLTQGAHAYLYAATRYLDQRGRPGSKSDLCAHDFVSFGDTEQMIGYLQGLGISLGRDNFRIGSHSGLVAWELVRQGFGIAPMSDEVANATPGIERVLPDLAPITFPVWLVTHRELHTARRIRVVFDLLAEFLSGRG